MNQRMQGNDDPLGLSDLPLLEPDRDGWSEIRGALEAEATSRRAPATGRWLALAACLVLVAGIVLLAPFRGPSGNPAVETVAENTAPAGEAASMHAEPDAEQASIEDLIAMSQILEHRLKTLRDNTAAMPAESAVYVAELEDLVARVDSQLGYEPDSIDLWGQRVNLLLDLEYLFQHQFEREYGRMASL